MVDSIRIVEKTLGKAQYKISKSEMGSRVFRRSLFVVKDVVAGEVFTKENVRSIRPAYGLPPKYINNLLCRRAAKNIERGTPLTWDLVS
jgi:sialic acid synthase SpsE